VSDEDLVRAEGMIVREVRGWLGHPLPGAVLREFADHHHQALARAWSGFSGSPALCSDTIERSEII
jgi:hypothetical protein